MSLSIRYSAIFFRIPSTLAVLDLRQAAIHLSGSLVDEGSRQTLNLPALVAMT